MPTRRREPGRVRRDHYPADTVVECAIDRESSAGALRADEFPNHVGDPAQPVPQYGAVQVGEPLGELWRNPDESERQHVEFPVGVVPEGGLAVVATPAAEWPDGLAVGWLPRGAGCREASARQRAWSPIWVSNHEVTSGLRFHRSTRLPQSLRCRTKATDVLPARVSPVRSVQAMARAGKSLVRAGQETFLEYGL